MRSSSSSKRKAPLAFSEFLAEGERKGLTRIEAAKRLLRAARQPSAQASILGICRISHTIEPTMKEQRAWALATPCVATLSLREITTHELIVRDDVEPSRIPVEVWEEFEAVGDDLVSWWQDDAERPREWGKLDWRAGALEARYDTLASWIGGRSDWQHGNVDSSSPVAAVSILVSALQVTPGFAETTLNYSRDELAAIIETTTLNSADRLERQIKASGGRASQAEIRALWRELRNPEGKPGPKGGEARCSRKRAKAAPL